MQYRELKAQEAPVTASSVAAAKSGAITSDQQAVVAVTQVVNSVTSRRGITLTVKNTTNADIENVPLFVGVFAGEGETEMPAGVTFKASGHKDFSAFQTYFAHISTRAKGMRLSTTNAAVFEQAELVMTEKEPDGRDDVTRFPLMEYLKDIGGGQYARTVEIPEQDLSPTFWPGQRIELSVLPANNTLTFFFPIKQWSKAQNMVDL